MSKPCSIGRWIHGEADGLPGVHVDLYGEAASVRCDGAGAAAFYRGLLDQLREAAAAAGIALRTVVERRSARRGGSAGGEDRTVLAEALNVEFDCLTDLTLCLFPSYTGRDTTGEIGYVRRKIRPGVLDHHCITHEKVTHFLNPACLRILFSVPGAKSSPSFPATVTRPALPGCLNCR